MTSLSEIMDTDALFENAMKGQWNEIVEAYEKDPRNQEAKITESEDTALHIAVVTGQTEIVFQLVAKIGERAPQVLHIKNKRGNTPLHIAAELGNVDMCKCMVSKSVQLIAARNNEGESPLFLAAWYGKMKAYICLHSFIQQQQFEDVYALCRKQDGNTILHSAIYGEYFSLALKIMSNFPKLVDYRNVHGQSPLNILASKPNAFKSSCYLGLFDSVIYKCTMVDELKEEDDHHASEVNDNCAANYELCMKFFLILQLLFQIPIEMLKRLRDCLSNCRNKNSCQSDMENPKQRTSRSSPTKEEGKKNSRFPPNYETKIGLFKFLLTFILVVLGFGFSRIRKIKEKKLKHRKAIQVMDQLIQLTSSYKYKYSHHGQRPANNGSHEDECVSEEHKAPEETSQSPDGSRNEAKVHENEHSKTVHKIAKETAILTAARMGITEIVEKILDTFPVAIQDLDCDNKNVVLLAVEHRQTQIYSILLEKATLKDNIFRQVDKHGNSALHLAAKYGDYKPWLIPGTALQMQWELKWYKFVKKSMPPNFFAQQNNKGLTAKEVFLKTHKSLIESGTAWLTRTSKSCSVIAALVATVTFATSSTVPGSFNENSTEPNFAHEVPFAVFAISSFIALCCSATALVLFLSVLTSRFEEKDFAMALPKQLLLGLTSLYTSIVTMLVSFCAAHFFVLEDETRYATYPIYIVTCLPVTLFTLGHLSLYADLTKAIFKEVPQRSFKVFSHSDSQT